MTINAVITYPDVLQHARDHGCVSNAWAAALRTEPPTAYVTSAPPNLVVSYNVNSIMLPALFNILTLQLN